MKKRLAQWVPKEPMVDKKRNGQIPKENLLGRSEQFRTIIFHHGRDLGRGRLNILDIILSL